MAHGVATDGNRIFVTGGSAKANSNFGPGLSEMEMCEVVEGAKPEWQLVGEMEEGRSFLGSVVLDRKVYQIGGCLSEEKSTTEVSFCENWNDDHPGLGPGHEEVLGHPTKPQQERFSGSGCGKRRDLCDWRL